MGRLKIFLVNGKNRMWGGLPMIGLSIFYAYWQNKVYINNKHICDARYLSLLIQWVYCENWTKVVWVLGLKKDSKFYSFQKCQSQNLHFAYISSEINSARPFYIILIPNTPCVTFLFYFTLFVFGSQKFISKDYFCL